MSVEDFIIDAQIREDSGKGASRRLRRKNLVPAIVYGGEQTPQSITLEHKTLIKHLEHEAFYSHIISLSIAGKSQDVILKDLQRHPAKPLVLHADFMRVSKDHKLTTKVPLHFINEDSAKGVKLQGGAVSHNMTQLEISCLPGDLPEYIEVDLSNLELGHSLHISDITLPKGVTSIALNHGAEHDLSVASINKPKGNTADTDDSDSDDAATEETPAQ